MCLMHQIAYYWHPDLMKLEEISKEETENVFSGTNQIKLWEKEPKLEDSTY